MSASNLHQKLMFFCLIIILYLFCFIHTWLCPILFQQRVRFHNTGPSMVPGVIVMSIKDAQNEKCEMAQLDKK